MCYQTKFSYQQEPNEVKLEFMCFLRVYFHVNQWTEIFFDGHISLC